MCIIKHKTKFHTIENVHNPTKDKDELQKDFYCKLESVINKISSYDMRTILGDFSAKTAKEEIHARTRRKHSVPDRSNEKGM